MTAAGMVNITAVLQARADADRQTADAIGTLLAAIMSGADLRHPPRPWRATYPLDDPSRYPPDLWIADDVPAGAVWCKSDGGHPLYEPTADGTCTWCGAVHVDPRPLYLFMDPSDY